MDMTAEESEVCVMSSSICIIGDSITGGVVYLSDSARYTHWKDSFVNLLGSSLDSELKNHSKFGCTSGAALKRLERYAKDISACPTTLVMLGGLQLAGGGGGAGGPARLQHADGKVRGVL